MVRALFLCQLIAGGLLGSTVAMPALHTAETGLLSWENLPSIPSAPGQAQQLGLAGPFAGTHADALIVAGGANFPGGPPWEGGGKVWWDDIYVLLRDGQGDFHWHSPSFKLPRRLAYGVSISTDGGLICIGGCDAEKCFADVFRLTWIDDQRRIEIESLPPLPSPLAETGGALIGQTIYVAGGRETSTGAAATTHFYALDLSREDQPKHFQWRELPAWPGPPRVLPVVAAQSDGESDCLFLFSGRNISPGQRSETLTDGYKYSPTTNRWTRVADVAPQGKTPTCVMGATSLGWGANHILLFGGDDGRLFLQREQIGRQLAATTDPQQRTRLETQLRRNFTAHPGFARDVLAYHTVTDRWTKVGQFPINTSSVTTTAVRWGDSIIIPSGEIRPGVRTAEVLKVTLANQSRFGALNYAVLGATLLALICMGLYFARSVFDSMSSAPRFGCCCLGTAETSRSLRQANHKTQATP